MEMPLIDDVGVSASGKTRAANGLTKIETTFDYSSGRVSVELSDIPSDYLLDDRNSRYRLGEHGDYRTVVTEVSCLQCILMHKSIAVVQIELDDATGFIQRI